MTLCITYRQGKSEAVCISDSLLTTTARKRESEMGENLVKEEGDTGAFLPSNVEVVHQTPHAVKVQIVSQKEHFYSGSNYDFVCAIAGNVSLGLQCLLHLESYLQGNYDIWFDAMEGVIYDKVYPFWSMARDQEVEFSIAISDHKRRTQIFEITSDGSKLFVDRVDEDNGVLLSVIGDESATVKENIMGRVNRMLMQTTLTIDEAVHICAIEALNEKIEDDSSIFIGGSIQGAYLNGYYADYLAFRSENVYFRGVEMESTDRLDFPYIDLKSSNYAISKSDW